MDPLPFTGIAPRTTGNPELDGAHERVRVADNAWRRARSERRPDEDVRSLARDYARLSADYQKLRFGRVVQRVSVSALLR